MVLTRLQTQVIRKSRYPGKRIAINMDNTMLFHELQFSNDQLDAAYNAMLEGWLKALELRDIETQEHCRRVLDLTLHLAQELGLVDQDLAQIRRGALLHDIGKIFIPDSILFKDGPLNAEEWTIMRKHPIYAYELLSSNNLWGQAIDIPLYHHERWDGSGYPHGLIGEQIPLSARIFSVVDTWDALLSDRPYRKAWSKYKAIAYICSEKGKSFDPLMVEIFIEKIT